MFVIKLSGIQRLFCSKIKWNEILVLKLFCIKRIFSYQICCAFDAKETMKYSSKPIKWIKEIKGDNFCYCKVGRAITLWGAIEKYSIYLSQDWKIAFWINTNYFVFWGHQ